MADYNERRGFRHLADKRFGEHQWKTVHRIWCTRDKSLATRRKFSRKSFQTYSSNFTCRGMCPDLPGGAKLRKPTRQKWWKLGPSRRQRFEQTFGFPEPGAFATTQVSRQGGFLSENSLRPLARLVISSLGCEEARIMQIGFGERGDLRGLPKQRLRLFDLPGPSIGVSKQSRSSIKIVFRIFCSGALQIRYSGCKISQPNFGQPT